jgi:hypothetical protein
MQTSEVGMFELCYSSLLPSATIYLKFMVLKLIFRYYVLLLACKICISKTSMQTFPETHTFGRYLTTAKLTSILFATGVSSPGLGQ